MDDTDLIQFNHNKDTTTEDTMGKMQEAIDRWEGGIKATGGALRPDKSWIYPIDFEFQPNGSWEYKTINEIDASFTVRDENNKICNLEQIEPDDSKETLGVFLSPSGANTAMIDSLASKTKEWNDLIRTGHMDRKEA